MSRARCSTALLSGWILLGFGALCAAGPAAGRSTIKRSDLRFDLSSLAPEARASLKRIHVLLLTDDNIHVVWKLAKRPELADVIVVACSPRCLSTDLLEALADWAKGGRGLFLEASAAYMASEFLLPEAYFIEPLTLDVAAGSAWLDRGSPLTANVRQVSRELWCSRNGRGRLQPRSGSEDPESLEDALSDLGETFMPVLSWSPQARESAPLAPAFGATNGPADRSTTAPAGRLPITPGDRLPILFASTFQGARVVWYAHDFHTAQDCSPEFDDVKLWSNLVHWLGRKEPVRASDSSTGQ